MDFLYQNCKGEDKILGRIGVRSFEHFLEESQHEEDIATEELVMAMESCTTR